MRDLIYSSLLSLLCTCILFIIHTLNVSNSMINFTDETLNLKHNSISNDYLAITVNLHKTHPAFVKRPLTTTLVDLIANNTALTIGESFVLVSFFLLFICGITFFYLAKTLLNDSRSSYLSQFLFYLSFSVFFSFFPTNYSYDEPIQYFLIAISLIALLKEKWGLFVLAFSSSLIARESGILLLPSIAFYMIPLNLKISQLFSLENLKKLIYLTIPVVIYIIYLKIFISQVGIQEETKSDLNGRFSHFFYNFQNQQFAIESVISIFLAVGFQVYILFEYITENTLDVKEKKMVNSFLLALILNMLVVLTTTRARETRLFALPLVFLWPIFGKYFLHELQLIKLKTLFKLMTKNLIVLSAMVMSFILCYIIYKFIYIPTGFNIKESFQGEYFLILMILICLHFIYKFSVKNKSKEILIQSK
jgi:hypothetical protein